MHVIEVIVKNKTYFLPFFLLEDHHVILARPIVKMRNGCLILFHIGTLGLFYIGDRKTQGSQRVLVTIYFPANNRQQMKIQLCPEVSVSSPDPSIRECTVI